MASNDNNEGDQTSPAKFVKPADLFKMRRRTSNNFAAFNTNSNSLTPIDNKSREAPSPLASNSKNATPVKAGMSSVSIQASPLKYNNLKKTPLNQHTPTKMFNLPPTFHIEPQSPLKCLNNISDPSPTKNLPVLLKNPFNQPVKRKLNLGASPRKQKSPNKKTRMLEIDEDANLEPPERKQQPKNIKYKVYQHPYLSWLPLFPRSATGGKDNKTLTFIDRSQAGEMMHKDWCDSLNDLTNLLIDGKCPHFYLSTDNYTVLFKTIPSSNSKNPFVQAFISPLNCGMGCALNKMSIEFKCPEPSKSNSYPNFMSIAQGNSQTSFSSSTQSRTNFEDDNVSQASRQANNSKVTASVDSGNASDLDDDFGEDENEDGSQFLESIGVTLDDCPSINTTRRGYLESDSNTKTKSTSNKHLGVVEGAENISKLVKFLQTNRLYTINTVGKFAFIPPTLISPCEFKLGTQRMIISKDLDLFPIKSTWSSK